MKMKIKTVQMISNDCKDEMKNREDIKVGHAMRHATVPAVLRATHVELPMFQNDSIMHVGKIGLNAHLIKMFAWQVMSSRFDMSLQRVAGDLPDLAASGQHFFNAGEQIKALQSMQKISHMPHM